MRQLINDSHFKVTLDPSASSKEPDAAIWNFQHVTVAECEFEEYRLPSNPADAVIRHQLGPKHFSVLEAAYAVLYFEGFPHSTVMQWVRHQDQKPLVQCLTGDSMITLLNGKGFAYTRKGIDYLYKMWTQGGKGIQSPKHMQSRIKKMRLRCLDESTGEFTIGHIKDIYSTGILPVYKVKLVNGYELKSTLNHRYMTNDGWKTLKDLAGIIENKTTGHILKINSDLPLLLTNGKTVGAGLYQKKEWLEAHLANGLTSKEIAREAGVSVESIKKWVYFHGLKLNIDPNAKWNKGSIPWNKDKAGTYSLTTTEARRKADKLRGQKHKGSSCNFWKGGVSDFRSQVGNWATTQKHELLNKYNKQCQYCQSQQNLEIDHILPISTHPSLAFTFENLQILCKQCHQNKSSYELRTVPEWTKIESIEFCGFQPTYDIEMDGANPSFTANGFVVHNSSRYTGKRFCKVASGELSVKEVFYFRPLGSYTDRQGNKYEYTVKDMGEDLRDCRQACHKYAYRINKGFSEEHARDCIPQNFRQNFAMAGTIRGWMHVLDQRTLADSQLEAQTAAWMALDVLKAWEPTLFGWYEEKRAGKNLLAP